MKDLKEVLVQAGKMGKAFTAMSELADNIDMYLSQESQIKKSIEHLEATFIAMEAKTREKVANLESSAAQEYARVEAGLVDMHARESELRAEMQNLDSEADKKRKQISAVQTQLDDITRRYQIAKDSSDAKEARLKEQYDQTLARLELEVKVEVEKLAKAKADYNQFRESL